MSSGLMLWFAGVLIAIVVIWRVEIWRTAKAKLDRQVSPVVALVLEMLERPDGWRIKNYQAVHQTGAAIWIGNTERSAALALDGDVSPHGMNRGPVVDTSEYERRALFAAVKRLQAKGVLAENQHKVVAWAARVEQFADKTGKRR